MIFQLVVNIIRIDRVTHKGWDCKDDLKLLECDFLRWFNWHGKKQV